MRQRVDHMSVHHESTACHCAAYLTVDPATGALVKTTTLGRAGRSSVITPAASLSAAMATTKASAASGNTSRSVSASPAAAAGVWAPSSTSHGPGLPSACRSRSTCG